MELRGIEQGAVEAGGDKRPHRPGACRGDDRRDGRGKPACGRFPESHARDFAALPNGRIRSGSAPIRRIACTLFSRPTMHNAAATTMPSGRATMRAAADRDQDHQREDDRAGGNQLAAKDTRMHGQSAGECEGHRRHQRHPPVAEDQAGKACEDQHASGRDQERQDASGANGVGHGEIERGGIAGFRHCRQGPGVEETEMVQQREPGFDRQNGQVGGVIGILLRVAGVHGERAVDHHEVHVGVAPIDHEIAEQNERRREADDDGGEAPRPAEKSHAIEDIARRGGLRGWGRGSCRGSCHGGGF